jgi:biotin transporter BioY
VVLAVLLYGTLVLAERRSGLIMMLIVGLGAVGMPIIHRGAGTVARSSGGFLFLWTLITLGVTGSLSVILAVRGLISGSGRGTGNIMPAVANESPDRRG